MEYPASKIAVGGTKISRKLFKNQPFEEKRNINITKLLKKYIEKKNILFLVVAILFCVTEKKNLAPTNLDKNHN